MFLLRRSTSALTRGPISSRSKVTSCRRHRGVAPPDEGQGIGLPGAANESAASPSVGRLRIRTAARRNLASTHPILRGCSRARLKGRLWICPASQPRAAAQLIRSLTAAVTANAAARVINIHPDNVGTSLTTVRVPDAAAPGAASLEVTCDVVLTCAPRTVPCTLTVIVHDWPPASTFEVLEKASVPGLMEKMPPPVASVLHVPPVWVMRSIPAGMVSLN